MVDRRSPPPTSYHRPLHTGLQVLQAGSLLCAVHPVILNYPTELLAHRSCSQKVEQNVTNCWNKRAEFPSEA